MRHTKTLVAMTGVCLLAACSDHAVIGPQGGPQASVQSGGVTHIMLTRAGQDSADRVNSLFAYAHGAKPGGGSSTGIFYHGGPVIHGENIVAIYWSNGTIYNGGPGAGTTGTGSQDGSLVGFFLRNIGGSGYWNINTTYTDGAGAVSNSLNYTNYWADNTSVPASGSTVSDAAVQQEVIKALSGPLTFDGNTLYAVFSDAGVNLGGGFGSQYCAYHGHFAWNGHDVKYAVMPHNIDFPAGCTAQLGSPNGDAAADAEVNTLAHETEETLTDEDLNAWYDRRGNENADKCAWKWGTTSTASNGATYNETFGGKNFLVQMNWVNAGSGGCLNAF